jgi:NAD(P)-dependent dehydrogenase (short-subunit alcohol dehydrogenase family)
MAKIAVITGASRGIGAATALYDRIREIVESASRSVARTVNSTQVMSNWSIGREIVEEEQKGVARAEYGERRLRVLAEQLQGDYGAGYSLGSLKLIRQFYQAYPELLGHAQIGHAARGQ